MATGHKAMACERKHQLLAHGGLQQLVQSLNINSGSQTQQHHTTVEMLQVQTTVNIYE